MSLGIGTHLGSLEVTALIGRGGMGEVYRARDTKLKREVAIKILPDEFSGDPERLIRFQREAEVLALLNHPNIATIYDLQEADGLRFIVLELVEGETLADHIARGPIPVEETLVIAKHVCEALEAAHEKGIIHRDLKPANVKITPEYKIKVLDFGLAKPVAGTAPTTLSNSPTLVSGSMGGVILGTAAYMSPEQASGKVVDKRSDIWSFGVVLWEMLTGKRLFDGGETVLDTLADVLRAEIDFTKLPANMPGSIRELLRRCLTRDVRKRLRDIGDARIVLENPESEPEVPRQAKARATRVPWALAALFGIVAMAVSFIHFRQQPLAERTLRYTIAPPENSAVHSFAISPDGRYLALAAAVNGKRQLWLRAMDGLQFQPMPDTEDATFPFWSPDSRYIGFFSQLKLKKIDASGGPAQSLCNAGVGTG
jgi:serine/threonine protein kinase